MRPGFLSQLAVHLNEDGRWEVTEPLVYLPTGGTTLTVPAGFTTDFASVPRLLWSAVGHPAGPYAPAAVLHDWLYATAPVGRARADGLFLEAMGALGVRWSQRWALYLGVRAGGWAAWRGHRLQGTPPVAIGEGANSDLAGGP